MYWLIRGFGDLIRFFIFIKHTSLHRFVYNSFKARPIKNAISLAHLFFGALSIQILIGYNKYKNPFFSVILYETFFCVYIIKI